MSIIRKDIQVTYDRNRRPRFVYEPFRQNGTRRVVADLKGGTAGNADYLLVFTLSGASWPETGWISFRAGEPTPVPDAEAPQVTPQQRFLTIRNDLTVGQGQRTFPFILFVVSQAMDEANDPDIVLVPPTP